MGELYLRRTLTGFAADDEASADAMRGYKVGDVYRANVVKPRNIKNHRRYWALINLVYQNTDAYKSADQLHQHLKILAGHCSPVVSKATGETWWIPESISFGSMDEIQFQDFWRRVILVVQEHILPGVDVDAVQYEIEKLVGLAA